MGYTTQFYGEFKIDPPVTKEFKNYINAFSDTRHCRWNAKEQIPCWELFSWKGDPGEDGMYFAMPGQLQKYFIRDSFPDADDQRPTSVLMQMRIRLGCLAFGVTGRSMTKET